MEAKFARDTSVTEIEPGAYEAVVNRDWWIVFGPNGGFVGALIMRAMTAAVADPARQPRSLTIHYTAAPAEGAVRIATVVERAGRSLTTVAARMTQGDRLMAIATGAFSLPRTDAFDFDDARAPDVPPPEELDTIQTRPDLPPFASQWEVRPALGAPPFSSAERAVAGGWLRPLEQQPIDCAMVAQLADAWVPAVFSRLDRPNPVPTVDLTVHFRAPLPLPADWVLARFETRLVRDGFLEEDGQIWSRDGRLIAQSRQLALMQAPSHE